MNVYNDSDNILFYFEVKIKFKYNLCFKLYIEVIVPTEKYMI